MKTVKITGDVAEVLSRSTVEGNIVRLPEGQLDRPLYVAVDKVLKALGGKWNTGKRGHVFADGIGEQLAQALDAGHVVDLKKTHEQFFTPPALAAYMADLLNIEDGYHVLEPSAGSGVLARAAIERGGTITAVEIDERNMAALLDVADIRAGWMRRICADFMEWTPPPPRVEDLVYFGEIDKVIMNPPFSRNQDIRHVRRAWEMLESGGELAAIMSDHAFFGGERECREFRAWIASIGAAVEQLPEGTFKESGTMVRARLIHARKGG